MKNEDKKSRFSYDAAIVKIESIVSRLENHETKRSFDDMIADVEEAMKLISQCKKSISEAETRLAKLTNKLNED